MSNDTASPVLVIVDDDEASRRALAALATHLGYRVTAFAAFEDARAYLTTASPDALLVDVRLGAYNGLQLIQIAKRRNAAIRAVAVSGFDDPVLAETAREMGAGYLTKPVTSDQVRAALGGNLTQP